MNFNSNNNFSINTWMNIETNAAVADYIYGIYKNTLGGQFSYFLMLDSTNVGYSVGVNCGGSTWPMIHYSVSNWIQATLVYSYPSITLYIKGSLIGYLNYNYPTAANSSGNLTFGALGAYSHCYRGFIDDVRIYSRTLTQDEVTALYHDGGFSN